MTVAIRSRQDILTVEAAGLDAFQPARSPYGLLRRAASLWPDACAIHFVPSDGRPDTRLTFAALFDRVNRAVALFRRLGAGPDAAVAVIMPHTLNTQVALWAAERAGLACPINPMLAEEQVAGLLRAANVRVAVVLGRNREVDVWDRAARAVRSVGTGIVLLDADGDAASPGSDGNFEALLDAEVPAALVDPDPASVASLFPTGGTTGAPKLTIHTHDNEAFIGAAAARMQDLRAGDVVLNGFPLFHVAGAFVHGMSSVAAGATQLVPGRLGMRNRPFMGTLWQQVERHRITVLGVVPTVMSGLLSQPVGNADITGVRCALTGGSLLPTDLADAFEARTGIPVRNIFGMTECSGMLTAEPVLGPRTPGSTGLPLPFTELRVVRPGTEEPSRPGEPGLVMTRGPHVSPGYRDPALGRDTFGPGGWLVTGDLGFQDENGRVFLTGRAKDVIIRGGHNIDPSGIEDALLRHPAVAVAAAIGMPDRHAGELPVAFVTLHPGTVATEADLLAHAAGTVPEPAACPKRIWIVDAMPVTPVGKVFKPALRMEATRHAVEGAIATLSLQPADLTVTVEPSIGTVVTVGGLSPNEADDLRAALAGMPVVLRASSP